MKGGQAVIGWVNKWLHHTVPFHLDQPLFNVHAGRMSPKDSPCANVDEHDPGAVPETAIVFPMRTAREKPMGFSKGEPEEMFLVRIELSFGVLYELSLKIPYSALIPTLTGGEFPLV